MVGETGKAWMVELWRDGDFDYAESWDNFDDANDYYEGEVEWLKDRPDIDVQVKFYAVSKVLLDSTNSPTKLWFVTDTE